MLISASVFAQNQSIAIIKSNLRESNFTNAYSLTELIAFELQQKNRFNLVKWGDLEARINKATLKEISKCNDSICISKFVSYMKTNHNVNLSFVLFTALNEGTDDRFSVTLTLADAKNGSIIALLSTNIAELEMIRGSKIVDKLINKIILYISNSKKEIADIKVFPGLTAINSGTDYFSILASNKKELKSYINLFNFHTERESLSVITNAGNATPTYPSVAINKNMSSTDQTGPSFSIDFEDIYAKNATKFPFSAQFFTNNAKVINRIVIKSQVPSQTKNSTVYYDLKKQLSAKINSYNFGLAKSDSMSGLYGPEYNYHYTDKSDSTIKLSFAANTNSFVITISKQ
jgi:hypothetical protein